MMKCPECPKSVYELGSLAYALVSKKFDKTPEEVHEKAKKEAERARAKGLDERVVQAYVKFREFSKHDLNSRVAMLKWGRTRVEAACNYLIHFYSPCYQCVELYTDFLKDIVIALMTEEGSDPEKNPDRIDELIEKVDRKYLGNPDLGGSYSARMRSLFGGFN